MTTRAKKSLTIRDRQTAPGSKAATGNGGRDETPAPNGEPRGWKARDVMFTRRGTGSAFCFQNGRRVFSQWDVEISRYGHEDLLTLTFNEGETSAVGHEGHSDTATISVRNGSIGGLLVALQEVHSMMERHEQYD